MSKVKYTEDGQIANPDAQLCFEILNHKIDYLLSTLYVYTYLANPLAVPHKKGVTKPPRAGLNDVMEAHRICNERIQESIKQFEERIKDDKN